MQVTGSKEPLGRQNRLSIRLRQGGQSFSLETTAECTSPEVIEVEVDTPLTAVHPADTALTPAEVLSAEGIVCPDGFQIIGGALAEPNLWALALLCDQAVDSVRDTASRFNAEVRYVPLLLRAVRSAMLRGRRSTRLALLATETNLYTAVAREGKLLFCDAFEYHSADDVLYIMAHLAADFDLRSADIAVGGGQKAVRHALKRNYKHVKCE